MSMDTRDVNGVLLRTLYSQIVNTLKGVHVATLASEYKMYTENIRSLTDVILNGEFQNPLKCKHLT